MKAYVQPAGHLSRAMFRVARALETFAPEHISIVKKREQADLIVEHVIGTDAIAATPSNPFVVIQYCDGPQHPGFKFSEWEPYWNAAELVWSYYDFSKYISANRFYHAPLGIDPAFRADWPGDRKRIGIVTSGYVSGPGAEAIEEVYYAAHIAGLTTLHIGPEPTRLQRPIPTSVGFRHGITDHDLARIYQNAWWVSGLRHLEGFELPVIEGLACGARPIVFDRADMHQWYDDHAVFVPECSGDELIERLVRVMFEKPKPIFGPEREQVLSRFDWESIVTQFWQRVTSAWEQRAA